MTQGAPDRQPRRPSLDSARLYLVGTARIGRWSAAELVPELAAAGVDLFQLREKELEAGDVIRAGAPIADACRAAGIGFVVNDRPDVALALDADGVHLGQNDLPVHVARAIAGERWIGWSTHSARDIARVASIPVDYVAVGPVHATPTKPGRAAVGLGLLQHAARALELPWFAIGGIDPSNLEAVMEAGARRIVVVRAVTGAADPVAAAARLAEMLRTVPL